MFALRTWPHLRAGMWALRQVLRIQPLRFVEASLALVFVLVVTGLSDAVIPGVKISSLACLALLIYIHHLAQGD